MIQRIQTVWWLASVVALAVVFFLPLFKLEGGDFLTTRCIALSVTIGICILLTIVNIFLYTNRMLQVKIGYGLIFLHLLIFLFIGVHYYLDKGIEFLPYSALPFASLLFQVLAVRGVKKDEALIKSMDRLR